MSNSGGRADNIERYVLPACLFTATVSVYFSVRGHEFLHFDDYLMVVDNPNLTRDLTPMSLLRHFWTPHWGNWLPITWISLHLDYAIHGADAGAFLLTNVLIHAAASVALFAALARMTGAVGCSLFVAGVFALHPLHVESVAWVTERKDVLAGLFWMLGLYAYAAWVETRSWSRYLAVAACLVLGLLSKALCVTFPFALLLLDYWPLARGKGAWRERIVEKLPLFAIVLLFAVSTYWTQQAAGHMGMSDFLGLTGRTVNAVQSYWLYLQDAFWPSGLAAVYPHPFALRPVTGRDELGALGLGLALLGATGLILVSRRSYLVVGWFWYLGTLVPMIGLVHVGSMARADRYMYVPLVGLAIMLAWGAADLAGTSRWRRHALAVLGGAVLAASSIATWMQIDHWKSSVALFERAVSVTERNRFAHENLAIVLHEQGRNEEAARHFEEAVRIEPRRTRSIFGLALASTRLDRRDDAIRWYEEGLALQPKKVRARGALGRLLVEAGRFAEAEEHLAFALRYFPDEAGYHEARGAALEALDRPADALVHYRRALELDPDFAVAPRVGALEAAGPARK